MRSKCISMLVLAVLAMAAACPLSAQSYFSAVQGGWPVFIGVGMSRFNMDFKQPDQSATYMEGPTVWADVTRIPFVPRRLGIEAEYRSLSMNAPSTVSKLSSSTFLGGPRYTFSVPRLAVFAKGMIGYGTVDLPYTNYVHDSRTMYAAGGGGEFRVWNGVWARADYEYQWWPKLFGHTSFNPNGLTFGVAYDLRSLHRSY